MKTDYIAEALMSLNDNSHGGVIKSADAAVQFAELILSVGNYDGPDWREQLPLRVDKLDGGWKVTGSYQNTSPHPGPGPWEMVFQSRDAKIISMSRILDIKSPPLKDLIRSLGGPDDLPTSR